MNLRYALVFIGSLWAMSIACADINIGNFENDPFDISFMGLSRDAVGMAVGSVLNLSRIVWHDYIGWGAQNLSERAARGGQTGLLSLSQDARDIPNDNHIGVDLAKRIVAELFTQVSDRERWRNVANSVFTIENGLRVGVPIVGA